MSKKTVLFFILSIISALISALAAGQIAYSAAGGTMSDTLQSGDRAVVSGDYVRVRTGPTVEYRILEKVNSGAEVTVLSRGDVPQKIGDTTSYWYQVKLDGRELTGWVFGAFLKRRESSGKGAETGGETSAVSTSAPSLPSAKQAETDRRVQLEEIGVVDEGDAQVAAGDLDRNGKPELLFIGKNKGGRSPGRPSILKGYEKSTSGFDLVYSVDMQGVRIGGIEVLSTKALEYAVLAVHSDAGRATSGRAGPGASGRDSASGRLSPRAPLQTTSLYTYDAGRSALRLAARINTPAIALGTLDGQNPFLVYLRANRSPDSDGTATYTLETVRVETKSAKSSQAGGRLVLKERYQYDKSLPVKKLTLFDLDGDGQDEIIAEIGGRDMGGGIAILALRDGSITKLVTSGIPTYDDKPFLSLWGASVGGKPRLVAYSTDPSDSRNESSEFGFVIASLSEGTLKVDRFLPVNRMLDEVNNGRRVVYFADGPGVPAGRDLPFLVIDEEGGADRSSVKRAVL